MADLATFNPVETLCSSPFLVKRLVSSAPGTTAGELVHGESRDPDLMFVTCNDVANPTANSYGVAAYSTTGTRISFDAAVDEACTIYLVWFGQPGTGGLTAP